MRVKSYTYNKDRPGETFEGKVVREWVDTDMHGERIRFYSIVPDDPFTESPTVYRTERELITDDPQEAREG